MHHSKLYVLLPIVILMGMIVSFDFKHPVKIDEIISKTPFEQFVDSIPFIPLPFELSTSDNIKHVDMQSQFIPEGAALIGKLKSRGDKHFIIYSYPADIRLPILEVYNSSGDKLNKIQLFNYQNCPLTSSGYSRFRLNEYNKIYTETVCDIYDSRIDQDSIVVEDLLKTN